MNGSLGADLGIGPEVWLFLSLLASVTLFFKFGRFWSVRNLDLVLIFALTPGMMLLVGHRSAESWLAFVWLFLGSLLWVVRSLLDLGLARRPLLEPNLNASGLTCLTVGLISLFMVETLSLPIDEGLKRNPADSKPENSIEPRPPGESIVDHVLRSTPIASSFTASEKPREILRRVIALIAQIALVMGLITIGWRHFERPVAGLSVASCYLLLPYTRFALVDSGQLLPAALIVGALVFYLRPITAGLLIGLAAGWMPACLGLIPVWASFYRKRGFLRFSLTTLVAAATCGLIAYLFPVMTIWCRALGARSLAEAGVIPWLDAPDLSSFWSGIDSTYRIPVLIAYAIMVVILTFLPARKNLAELIALSASLLSASQFWYLDAGGTLVQLYLPLVLLMMFRPNLSTKRILPRTIKPT